MAGSNGQIDEIPISPAQNNGNLMFLLEHSPQPGPDDDGHQNDKVSPAQDYPREIPTPISVPGNGAERRPYHALSPENVKALNAFLAREVLVMMQQLPQTTKLTNQLIRRQKGN